MKRLALAIAVLFAAPANADEIGCVDTTWRLIGKNDAVCIGPSPSWPG